MKILIVGPAWVGDMVMAQTLFISLLERYPDAQIDVLAPDWCRALLEVMPQVHSALALSIGHGELGLGRRREIGKALRANGYDQAIVLPNSFKSALIPWFAGIAVRTGWRGEKRGWLLNDCRDLDKSRYPLMVQRFAALALDRSSPLPERLPYPALVPERESIPGLRQSLGLLSDKPVLVLCPGAEFGPAKQWPVAHYADVAAHYAHQGWQVWLLGSGKDAPVALQILQQIPQVDRAGVHNLCGTTSLSEAVQLLSVADAVVSNDSGLMHIAAALQRPLVVVYGSTSPDFTPPLAEQVTTLSLGLSCSPCFKRECPLQHLNCLRQLGPEQVLLALQKLAHTQGQTGATG